jgi:hypothetical protein
MRARPWTGIGRRRGQVSHIALLGISLAVLIIVFLFLRWGRAERQARTIARAGTAAVDDARDLAEIVESALRDAVEEATYELGRHGGYTAATLPGPTVGERPVFFLGGRMILFPSVRVMEQLLGQEATRRLGARLDAVRADANGTISFGAPLVTVKLNENSVEASLELTYTLNAEGGTARSVEDMSVVLDLRLRALWSRAKAYLEAYARERYMERSLLSGIINDERIPSPPGGPGETMSCRKRKVLATGGGMAEPFSENARLSVARELQRIREAAADEREIEWSMRLTSERVNMTFLANPGTPLKSNDTIEYIAVPIPFLDRRGDVDPMCLSRYNVSYTVRYPVMMTVRDLRPAARGARTGGRPLEFVFVLEPFMAGIDPFARLGELFPPSVDDLCAPSGQCEMELAVTGPNDMPVDGRAWLDTCVYGFEKGKLERTPVPCGERTLIVEALLPPGLGRYVERVEVDGLLSRRIQLGARGRVHGRVYVNDRVWCAETKRVKAESERALGFVEGVPPRAVRLHLVPLDGTLALELSAVADEEALYTFPEVDAGTYMLLALPSTDAANRPAYKVRSRGLVVTVGIGDLEVPVEMYPLIPVHTSRGYEYVTRVEDC